MTKTYTINNFKTDYPTDEACLNKIFMLRTESLKRCPKCGKEVTFQKVKDRRCYYCPKCYYQYYPTKGTIFEKTTTPLTYWFYSIFLFTTSKNGLSACELQRQIGVTYKTAFRMLHQIRTLLSDDSELFNGIIELDESYIGGKNKNRHKDKRVKNSQGRSYKDKIPIFGILQRGGNVSAYVVSDVKSLTLTPIIVNKVAFGSKIMTDEWNSYSSLRNLNYSHEVVYHSRGEYVKNNCYTNGLENFWSVVKRTINGSYIHVSKKYMQNYMNEVSFRYNNRSNKNIFKTLLNLSVAA